MYVVFTFVTFSTVQLLKHAVEIKYHHLRGLSIEYTTSINSRVCGDYNHKNENILIVELETKHIKTARKSYDCV